MPLDTQSALLKLNPLASLQPLGGGGETEYQTQQLKLMREQFEEVKRKNAEEEAYRRMAQAEETKRAQLALQKQQQEDRARAAAVNLAARQQAMIDFGKASENTDSRGMAIAAERLNQLGGYARRLDTGGPFPAWQIDLEPPKTPPGLNPIDSLGYGTLGTPDSLSETDKGAAPALSTEDAFKQAGSVAPEAAAPPANGDPTTDAPDALTSEYPSGGGEGPPAPPRAPAPQLDIPGLTPGMTSFTPRRAAEAPDMTGGVTNDVPQDVINTAALQYEQKQRLGPVMAGLAKAYPQQYQPHIEQAGDAILEGGFSPEKTMEYANSARTQVGGAVEKEQEHAFKLDEEAAKAAAEEKDPIKILRRKKMGETAAKEGFVDQDIKKRADILDSAGSIEEMLTNSDKYDDTKVINMLMKLDAQVGAQSDKDADRMTGEAKASFLERIHNFIESQVNGSYPEEVKQSMLDWARKLAERHRDVVNNWIDTTARQASEEKDPLAAEGMRRFVEKAVPRSVLDAYHKEAGDAEEPGGSAGYAKTSYESGGASDALDAQAEDNGLDAGAIRRVIGGESGGDPTAASKKSSAKGLWQALDSTAQRYTNPQTGQKFADSAELAKLSPEEQYGVLMQYLKDSGVTADSPPEDYALAIAAPAFVGKSANEDAVVYPKGSADWKANAPWQPANGGDITVGSIIDYYFGNKKKTAKPAAGGNDDAKLQGLF